MKALPQTHSNLSPITNLTAQFQIMKSTYLLFSLLLSATLATAQINTRLLGDQLNFRDGTKTLAGMGWDGTDLNLYNYSGNAADILFGVQNEFIFQNLKGDQHLRILSDGKISVGEDPLRPVDARMYVYNGDGGDNSNIGSTKGVTVQTAPSIWTRYGLYSYVSGAAEGVDISTQGQKIGLSVNARSSGAAKIGVSAYAGIGVGTNYGIHATVNGIGGAESYAVYGAASGGNGASTPGVWAGYFSGDVYSTGSYLPSDKLLKTNIRKAQSSLERLQQLQVKTYSYQAKYHQQLGLDRRPQTGFIAQEMEAVFPELTRRVAQPMNHPEELAPGEKESFLEFTGVNYVGLIPHLTRAVQEQQAQIEQLEAVNDELLARLERLEAALFDKNKSPESTPLIPFRQGALLQNAPNPFSETTSISYLISQQVQQAELKIVDAAGRVLKSIEIDDRGEGVVRLQAHTLSAGAYTYSLVLDGQVIETRQMVLTK